MVCAAERNTEGQRTAGLAAGDHGSHEYLSLSLSLSPLLSEIERYMNSLTIGIPFCSVRGGSRMRLLCSMCLCECCVCCIHFTICTTQICALLMPANYPHSVLLLAEPGFAHAASSKPLIC